MCVPVVEAAEMRAISLSLGGHEVLEGNVSGSNSVSSFQPGPSLTALAAAMTQIAPSLPPHPPHPPPLLFFILFFSRWLRWVFDSCAFCTSSHCNVHLCLRAVFFCVPFFFSFIHLFIFLQILNPLSFYRVGQICLFSLCVLCSSLA